jgi:hypothetical protein
MIEATGSLRFIGRSVPPHREGGPATSAPPRGGRDARRVRLLAFIRFDRRCLSAHGGKVTMFASRHDMTAHPSTAFAALAPWARMPICAAYLLYVQIVEGQT